MKCSATDIIFDATAVTGAPVNAVVTNEQTDPNSGEELRYRIDFTIPPGEQGPVGPTPNIQVGEVETTTLDPMDNASVTVTRQSDSTDLNPKFDFEFEIPRGNGIDVNNNLTAATISSTTIISKEITATTVSANTIIVSSITADEFVKSGGTDIQYLMADGSVTILSAGTNVYITTGGTADERIITISSNDIDSDTWRNIKVNGGYFLGTGITTGALNLSAGTNITLTTGSNGTVVISSTNSSTDTKNTAGTTNSTDKIYLVGGKTQDTYTTTYSNSNVYASGGTIYANNFYINEGGGGGGISITDMMPTGSIVMWAGSTAPSGWLMCTGGSIEVTAATSSDYDYYYILSGAKHYYKATNSVYRKLVKIIGRTYGHISDSEETRVDTHILLPNLQQRFPLGALEGGTIGKQGTGVTVTGWSTSLAATGGASGQTLSINEMPRHNHAIQFRTYGTGGSNHYFTGADTATNDFGYENVAQIGVKGDSMPHNNIPPYLAVNFIIKYA